MTVFSAEGLYPSYRVPTFARNMIATSPRPIGLLRHVHEAHNGRGPVIGTFGDQHLRHRRIVRVERPIDHSFQMKSCDGLRKQSNPESTGDKTEDGT